MKKIFFMLIIAQFLLACSSMSNKKEVLFNYEYIKDINGFNILVEQFTHNIENIWGINEIIVAGPKDFIKYSDQYKTRSHFNFSSGSILIETIANSEPKKHLKKAIIATLLIGKNLGLIDFYFDNNSGNDIVYANKSFLYRQEFNQNNQYEEQWEWRATRLANFLLKNALKCRQSGLRIIWFITIQLVPSNLDKRAKKYWPYITQASVKYGVDALLILAIMQIESNFNPYAISSSKALGLMQITPNYAGRDVFKIIGKLGIPSRKYLFNPSNNINVGTAYLALLQNTYLVEITNIVSRRYITIAAYNSGVNSVLKLFHSNIKTAIKVINQMQPDDVYRTFLTKRAAPQLRNYLIKVDNVQKKFF